MHKCTLVKKFETKDIPTELLDGINLKKGQSILINVDIHHNNNTHKKLSEHLVNIGALDTEKVYIFCDR